MILPYGSKHITRVHSNYMLSPSKEQVEIVDAVISGNNVCVDAVAGSGKTTTLLFIGKALPDKRIAVITYNSRLKTETRDKVKEHGLSLMKVHSYHSYAKYFYIDPCLTDTEIIKATNSNLPVLPNRSAKFDIFIIDEAQDMTPIYFHFVCKAFRDSGAKQLIVLGDHLQCIYDFPQKGADVRFLTLAEKLFPSPVEWVKRTLHTSYRITKSMEYFVNHCLLGYPRMKNSETKKKNESVKYLTGDPFEKIPKYICDEIRMLLTTQVCKASDIFILAPSIRSRNEKNPVKKLENELVKEGFPCYVPFSDDEELKNQVIQGKIVFSSFHQSKGLERKYVFVLSFSSSFYFTFRDASKYVCPPLLYVACTRAMEVLYLCGEDRVNGPLPFLKYDALTFPHIEIIPLSKRKKGETPPSTPPDDVMVIKRVTDLIRFMPEQTVMLIMDLCKMTVITPPSESIEIQGIIETTDGRTEIVSDLNGIAIPAIYEHRNNKRISIQEDIKEDFLTKIDDKSILDSDIRKQLDSAIKVPKTSADYLLLANVYSAYISGYLFKIKQIKTYSWLPKKTMEDLLAVLARTVGVAEDTKQLFEHTLSIIGYTWKKKTLQIEGRADLIDSNTLWELKCVESIKAEHCIQLALYAWLWEKVENRTKGRRKFCIHNIRTGEVQELKGIENLDYIMESVLDSHFRTVDSLEDDTFIKKVISGVPTETPTEIYQVCQIIDD